MTFKTIFKTSFVLCLVSVALFVLNVVFFLEMDNISFPIHLVTKIYLVLGMFFGFLGLIFFVITPRPKTSCVSCKFSFANFEELNIHLKDRLFSRKFKESAHFKTKYGYDVFTFKKGTIKKEFFLVIKINQYLGADSLNDIPIILQQKFSFGIENMSWSIIRISIVLCFNESCELWYSDFLNIEDLSNNQSRYFWTAMDLSEEQLYFFVYRDNIPPNYYKKMREDFLKIMDIDNKWGIEPLDNTAANTENSNFP